MKVTEEQIAAWAKQVGMKNVLVQDMDVELLNIAAAYGAEQRERELLEVKVGEFDHPEHCWKWTKLEVDFVNKQLAAARLQGAREEPVNAGLAKLAHTQALRIKELEQASSINQQLLMALRSALYLIDENKLTCHHLHHSTKDFHEWDEPCDVEVLAKKRLASIRAEIAAAEAHTGEKT